jgi:hypothetical protein
MGGALVLIIIKNGLLTFSEMLKQVNTMNGDKITADSIQ